MVSRMSKPRLIMAIVVVAIIAIVAIALSRSSSSPSDSTPQPSEAPNFTLPTMAGANITLSKLEGTPVVINFWATWCYACCRGLPYFERVAQQSEGEIKVIVINVGQSASTVRKFFRDYEPTMIVALDENRQTFVNYCQKYNNVKGFIPFTVFVDSEGIVRYLQIGPFASEAALWDKLNDVLGITIP